VKKNPADLQYEITLFGCRSRHTATHKMRACSFLAATSPLSLSLSFLSAFPYMTCMPPCRCVASSSSLATTPPMHGSLTRSHQLARRPPQLRAHIYAHVFSMHGGRTPIIMVHGRPCHMVPARRRRRLCCCCCTHSFAAVALSHYICTYSSSSLDDHILLVGFIPESAPAVTRRRALARPAPPANNSFSSRRPMVPDRRLLAAAASCSKSTVPWETRVLLVHNIYIAGDGRRLETRTRA
jgi:hypothetical protein